MSDTGENYTTFNSRTLVEIVGDVTDEALKATKIKQLLSVLAGRFSIGLAASRCSHFTLESSAVQLKWPLQQLLGLTATVSVYYSSSPRQSDVLLVNGPISKKFADPIVRLWEQMPEPKYCIAMGECAISGGPYYQSYNILEGVDTVIPVDVYIPGCPPRPEALIDGFGKLREKIIRIGGAPSSGRDGDKPIIVGED